MNSGSSAVDEMILCSSWKCFLSWNKLSTYDMLAGEKHTTLKVENPIINFTRC